MEPRILATLLWLYFTIPLLSFTHHNVEDLSNLIDCLFSQLVPWRTFRMQSHTQTPFNLPKRMGGGGRGDLVNIIHSLFLFSKVLVPPACHVLKSFSSWKMRLIATSHLCISISWFSGAHLLNVIMTKPLCCFSCYAVTSSSFIAWRKTLSHRATAWHFKTTAWWNSQYLLGCE